MEPPELTCYRLPDRIHYVVWCAHCRRWHHHGATLGHHVAHCMVPGSPYADSGYILVGGDPAPASVVEDAARLDPSGPRTLPGLLP